MKNKKIEVKAQCQNGHLESTHMIKTCEESRIETRCCCPPMANKTLQERLDQQRPSPRLPSLHEMQLGLDPNPLASPENLRLRARNGSKQNESLG